MFSGGRNINNESLNNYIESLINNNNNENQNQDQIINDIIDINNIQEENITNQASINNSQQTEINTNKNNIILTNNNLSNYISSNDNRSLLIENKNIIQDTNINNLSSNLNDYKLSNDNRCLLIENKNITQDNNLNDYKLSNDNRCLLIENKNITQDNNLNNLSSNLNDYKLLNDNRWLAIENKNITQDININNLSSDLNNYNNRIINLENIDINLNLTNIDNHLNLIDLKNNNQDTSITSVNTNLNNYITWNDNRCLLIENKNINQDNNLSNYISWNDNRCLLIENKNINQDNNLSNYITWNDNRWLAIENNLSNYISWNNAVNITQNEDLLHQVEINEFLNNQINYLSENLSIVKYYFNNDKLKLSNLEIATDTNNYYLNCENNIISWKTLNNDSGWYATITYVDNKIFDQSKINNLNWKLTCNNDYIFEIENTGNDFTKFNYNNKTSKNITYHYYRNIDKYFSFEISYQFNTVAWYYNNGTIEKSILIYDNANDMVIFNSNRIKNSNSSLLPLNDSEYVTKYYVDIKAGIQDRIQKILLWDSKNAIAYMGRYIDYSINFNKLIVCSDDLITKKFNSSIRLMNSTNENCGVIISADNFTWLNNDPDFFINDFKISYVKNINQNYDLMKIHMDNGNVLKTYIWFKQYEFKSKFHIVANGAYFLNGYYDYNNQNYSSYSTILQNEYPIRNVETGIILDACLGKIGFISNPATVTYAFEFFINNTKLSYINTSGSYVVVSSRLRKHHIKNKNNNDVLSRLMKLNVRSYGYKNECKLDDKNEKLICEKNNYKQNIGFILEEMYEIFPNCTDLDYNYLVDDDIKLLNNKKNINDFTEKELIGCGINYQNFLLYFFIGFQEHIKNYTDFYKNYNEFYEQSKKILLEYQWNKLINNTNTNENIKNIISEIDIINQNIKIMNNRINMKSPQSEKILIDNHIYDEINNKISLQHKQIEILENENKELKNIILDLQNENNNIKSDLAMMFDEIKFIKNSLGLDEKIKKSSNSSSPLNKKKTIILKK